MNRKGYIPLYYMYYGLIVSTDWLATDTLETPPYDIKCKNTNVIGKNCYYGELKFQIHHLTSQNSWDKLW